MNDLDFHNPYPSSRAPVLGCHLVATSQPLAAQAGLRMMLKGGNAVDAAIAMAMALTVLEPTGCGLASDALAIVWDGAAPHGLNGSGRSPAGWTAERFVGREVMPQRGWDSVTVPGAVSAWIALSRRFGRLPFATLAEPAIAGAGTRADGAACARLRAEPAGCGGCPTPAHRRWPNGCRRARAGWCRHRGPARAGTTSSWSPPEAVFAFGGAQLVLRTEDGYVAGSDPPKDGQAVAFRHGRGARFRRTILAMVCPPWTWRPVMLHDGDAEHGAHGCP